MSRATVEITHVRCGGCGKTRDEVGPNNCGYTWHRDHEWTCLSLADGTELHLTDDHRIRVIRAAPHTPTEKGETEPG